MRIMIGKIGEWFDRRLQLAAPIREAAEHPVPRNTASWFYVFGSAALTVFLLQLVTGILLALIYVPSAGQAWSSLQALNHDVALETCLFSHLHEIPQSGTQPFVNRRVVHLAPPPTSRSDGRPTPPWPGRPPGWTGG